MDALLSQLQLDETFFYQFVIFGVFFAIVSSLYFRPFQKLFHYRNQKTVTDREAAEKLIAEANAKFEAYKSRLQEERLQAKKYFDTVIAEAKKEEAAILNGARNEAKRIVQDAQAALSKQQDQARKSLESEIERIAQGVTEQLLARK